METDAKAFLKLQQGSAAFNTSREIFIEQEELCYNYKLLIKL